MSVVAIVYFSGYGHTAKQAEAVADGVRSAGATAVYRLTDQGDLPDATTLEDVGQANAIIYGSPTYMGGPLGSSRNLRMPVRRFSDRKPGKTK